MSLQNYANWSKQYASQTEKVSLILIATTLQNHTYVGDNTNSAKMFLTGLKSRT